MLITTHEVVLFFRKVFGGETPPNRLERFTMNEIKNIRAKTGLSQAKFAKKYGIPRRSIENWEMGVNEPPEYLQKLLNFRVETDLMIVPMSLGMKKMKWDDDAEQYVIDEGADKNTDQ